PRRLPPRVRSALDRRPRLPGHHGARRGRREAAGLRHLRPRRARPRPADRALALPARADGRAHRGRRRPDRGLARPPLRRRELLGIHPSRERRGAGRTGRPRAGEGTSTGGGGVSTFELIDELEAGELAIEFEGEEPQALLEWAVERFGSG